MSDCHCQALWLATSVACHMPGGRTIVGWQPRHKSLVGLPYQSHRANLTREIRGPSRSTQEATWFMWGYLCCVWRGLGCTGSLVLPSVLGSPRQLPKLPQGLHWTLCEMTRAVGAAWGHGPE